jgi:hypothetical protein
VSLTVCSEHQQTVRARGRARRLASWAIVVAALVALSTSAASFAAHDAAPPATPRALGDFFLGSRMARAEVIAVVGAAVRDIRIDQGRVVSSTPTSLVVLERDGTRQTIPIGSATQIYGRSQLAHGRGKANVLTIREGDAPAQAVYAGDAGRLVTPKSLGQLYMGSSMARAEVVMMVGNVVHDFRIDQGRVVNSTPTSLVLLERDNTSQTISVSAATEVWLGNQLADLTALEPRLNVLTIRDGDQPAKSVRVAGNRPQGGRR